MGTQLSGQPVGSPTNFWTAGGLRPKDLEFLRSVYDGERPEPTASPALVALCGLPGSGKSHFARELSARAPFLWLNSDRTRRLLAPRPQYSRREHRRVFAAMHVLTRGYLREGCSVVFDATNLNENVRRPLYAVAADAGVDPLIIRFTVCPWLARQRLDDRAQGIGDAAHSEATWEIYRRMAGADQPAPRPHLWVRGPADLEPTLAETLRRTGLGQHRRTEFS